MKLNCIVNIKKLMVRKICPFKTFKQSLAHKIHIIFICNFPKLLMLVYALENYQVLFKSVILHRES